MANLGIKNKNAGNLKDPSTGNFRVFSTPEAGHQALIDDIKIKQSGKSKHIKPGASLMTLANVWAPASDNNIPQNWANNVAKTIGVDTNTPFDKIPAEKLAQGIRVAEGTGEVEGASTQKSYSSEEFGQMIKQKHPEYADMPNGDLTQKILAKYPQYSDMVSGSQSLNSALGNAGTPPTPDQSGGDKDLLDKAGGVAKGYLKLTGGNKVAESIGTLGGYGYEKLKGAFGGKDNSEFYDTSAPSVGATALDGLRMVLTGKSIKSVGGLLDKVLHPTTALQNPIAQEAIKKYVPEVGDKGLAELMSPEKFGAADKLNALTEALEGASTSNKIVLQKAIEEIAPSAMKELGVASFSELHPLLAKGLGVLGGTAKGALKYGSLAAGLGAGTYYGAKGLLSQALKGKDLSNRSATYNQQ